VIRALKQASVDVTGFHHPPVRVQYIPRLIEEPLGRGGDGIFGWAEVDPRNFTCDARSKEWRAKRAKKTLENAEKVGMMIDAMMLSTSCPFTPFNFEASRISFHPRLLGSLQNDRTSPPINSSGGRAGGSQPATVGAVRCGGWGGVWGSCRRLDARNEGEMEGSV